MILDLLIKFKNTNGAPNLDQADQYEFNFGTHFKLNKSLQKLDVTESKILEIKTKILPLLEELFELSNAKTKN